jgi:hypothetical protein
MARTVKNLKMVMITDSRKIRTKVSDTCVVNLRGDFVVCPFLSSFNYVFLNRYSAC